MASNPDPFTTLDPDEVRDLGFGETVAGDPTRRLLNKDGTFNAGRVRRRRSRPRLVRSRDSLTARIAPASATLYD